MATSAARRAASARRGWPRPARAAAAAAAAARRAGGVTRSSHLKLWASRFAVAVDQAYDDRAESSPATAATSGSQLARRRLVRRVRHVEADGGGAADGYLSRDPTRSVDFARRAPQLQPGRATSASPRAERSQPSSHPPPPPSRHRRRRRVAPTHEVRTRRRRGRSQSRPRRRPAEGEARSGETRTHPSATDAPPVPPAARALRSAAAAAERAAGEEGSARSLAEPEGDEGSGAAQPKPQRRPGVAALRLRRSRIDLEQLTVATRRRERARRRRRSAPALPPTRRARRRAQRRRRLRRRRRRGAECGRLHDCELRRERHTRQRVAVSVDCPHAQRAEVLHPPSPTMQSRSASRACGGPAVTRTRPVVPSGSSKGLLRASMSSTQTT